MSQAFSLYSELTVRQNLDLHARLFHVSEDQIPARVAEMVRRFGLEAVLDDLPEKLPLGIRQRLSLAVAMVHKPELLILDEPTSGVDPVARDAFWRLLVELSRRDRVTIFISTHFMNEAERCDRMSMMHAGKVLDSDAPARLVEKRGAATLEEAFIGYLVEAGGEGGQEPMAGDASAAPIEVAAVAPHSGRAGRFFSVQRMLSYMWRETLELQRDPVRATMALAGSVILLLVMGFGISTDVNELRYAILDRDQSSVPAMLAALAVVREKEIGSIINLYVTPVTRAEFLLGKQLPYVALAMINFILMVLMAVFLFGVPIKGSPLALALAALLFCFIATGMGLLASAITKSQIAALFLAMVGTLMPATTFGGMTDPVSSLEGGGRLVGEAYPATHMFTISRGVFNKGLSFADLGGSFLPLIVAVPLIIGFAILLLRKQER